MTLKDNVSARAAILACVVAAACNSAPAATSDVSPAAQGADICRAAEVGVQVLGSGGPIAEGSRAGTSYAVWIDGRVRLLIDAGPGSFIRFGEAGLKVSDLKAIALSHFHADHSAGLAGILNSGSFEASVEPLLLIGPAAGTAFPGAGGFVSALVNRDGGAWSYLAGYIEGGDGRRVLDVREIPAQDAASAPTVRTEIAQDLSVVAIPVRHGEVPSLAFLVTAKDRDIVFASDQSAFSDGFERLLRDHKPDLLIAHHAIPEGEGQPIGLHRPPTEIGRMAANIAPGMLLLSHHMDRSFSRVPESLAAIEAHFDGPTMIAADGTCVGL
ncbi:MBL fold metallo-hydrolase [Hoeflea sp.]|uniref:MBL fold metallo-hydrolase n=1 Tax=Hoeflea sp. TaxID=1940281 RepID=UPI0019BFB8AB|nr:MBL fold metallo-hydrolase [Hoeflea sp.]MBC7285484.1 MBL fold metallo-hydrolase [Hoeflea sp.]